MESRNVLIVDLTSRLLHPYLGVLSPQKQKRRRSEPELSEKTWFCRVDNPQIWRYVFQEREPACRSTVSPHSVHTMYTSVHIRPQGTNLTKRASFLSADDSAFLVLGLSC